MCPHLSGRSRKEHLLWELHRAQQSVEQGALWVQQHLPYWALGKKEAGNGKAPVIWSLSGENILHTKQEKSIYVKVNVSNKGATISSKKLSRETFYPLVLLALQSLSPSICRVTNMQEHTWKCLHLSLSVGFQKKLSLNASIGSCVKARHCLVLSILLQYLHAGFYSESHFLFSSLFFSQHS